MKKILSISLAFTLLWSCSAPQVETENNTDDVVSVSGTVGFPSSEGAITIQRLRVDNAEVHTIPLNKEDYTFEISLEVPEPGYYQLNFYNKQFLNVVLDKDDITVNVDGNSAAGFAEVIGSPDAELVETVQTLKRQAEASPEMQELTQAFQQATLAGNEEQMQEIQAEYAALLNRGYDSIVQVIQDAPPSIALADVLMQAFYIDKDKYLDVYIEAAQKIQDEYPEAAFAKNFVEYVNKTKLTSVGQVAPEIALPNPDGEVVALSSFRGKYVLVDFWAKWCGPCRQENPNIVKAYNEYNDQGFEVFGVSLDRSKEDWLQGIQEDGLSWTHVSDLKYFNSQAAADYNINAIPFSILVNPEGVIIAKNLRGPALHTKLEEIFGS